MKIVVRPREILLSDDVHQQVERSIAFALDRFRSRINHVSVSLSDLNGPRGGVDKLCQMTADLNGAEPVLIVEKGDDLLRVVNRAARRLGYRVGRTIQRRRITGTRQYRTTIRAA